MKNAKRKNKKRAEEAMAIMDDKEFAFGGCDFISMENKQTTAAGVISVATANTTTGVDKQVKKAADEVMKRHKDLFKKLAPRDTVYNLEFDDIIVLAEATCLLAVFFQNDYEKITSWLTYENLNLGGTTPIKMIQAGRGSKLISFIKTSLDENGI